MTKNKNSKDNTAFDFNPDWYNVWMKQTKTFFDSAADLFTPEAMRKPEDHLQQMNAWLETLKAQWTFSQLNEQQKSHEKYLKEMSAMCIDAADLMSKQWVQRAQENNPVKNARELYELWLNCCNEVYAKAMHSQSYQNAYGDLMNATIHYWKAALNK
jgi:GR25 family glycosyltransferase involved in LPS biosynthesis